MFVSAPKKTLARSWSLSLIASGNWTQPHVRSNHKGPGRNNLRIRYRCLTHNCQASRKLLNFSVPTWSSLSLFWICFDSSSFLLNHSVLTVASSFFLSPSRCIKLHCSVLSALLFKELSILSLLSEYLESGLLFSKRS